MDLEARAHSAHPETLRLWLRLLTCTQLIEKQVRTGLREEFNTTLPRFDLMAQLEREPQGMKPVTDQLVKEGLIERISLPDDRRAWLIRLTPKGRTQFKKMAKRHETWIVQAFETLSSQEVKNLHTLLGRVKQHSKSSAEST